MGEGGEHYLRATSHGGSSAIFKELNISPSEHPVLSWEWKAVKFPSHKKNKILADKPDNDYAARVYVVFGKHNPFTSDMIQYIWDDYFPEGAHTQSPYSERVKILVVKKGHSDPEGRWTPEKRDLVKDYEMLFSKPLQNNVRAVAIMSDSDNTRTESEAYFKRLSIQISRA